jgi:hypothetical protein
MIEQIANWSVFLWPRIEGIKLHLGMSNIFEGKLLSQAKCPLGWDERNSRSLACANSMTLYLHIKKCNENFVLTCWDLNHLPSLWCRLQHYHDSSLVSIRLMLMKKTKEYHICIFNYCNIHITYKYRMENVQNWLNTKNVS